MSSSNRTAEPCDAVLTASGQPTGPLRLPEEDAAAFVAQFNRTYAQLGIAVRPCGDRPMSSTSERLRR